MEIKVESVKTETYHNGFGYSVGMQVAMVRFPEYKVTMFLSHRDDDPADLWVADCRIDNGIVLFSHGSGDRGCKKQIAGPEITDEINAFLSN